MKALLPFHLVVDEALTLRQAGPGVARLVPGLEPGQPLQAWLELASPPLPLTPATLEGLQGRAVVLKRRDGQGLRLGGAFNPHPAGHLLLAYPQAGSIDELLESGLDASLLPPGDPLAYFVGTLVVKSVALSDLEELTRTLERRVFERTRELDAARVAAEAASEAKSAFLASVSHEIRTPLHGVLGTLELLALGPLNHAQRHQASVIERSGRLLLALLDDVLDLSKLDAGRMVLESSPLDLGALVMQARDAMAAAAVRKGLALTVDLAPGLDLLRLGDASRLMQILLNLLGNAIKFTERGEVQLRLAPAPGAGAHGVRLAVADTGPGVPPQARGELFQAFSQLHDEARLRKGGTGLGLAIVARLAEAAGGRAGHEPVAEGGSVFWVELPMPPAPAQVKAVGPVAGEGPQAWTGPRLRVLVAEDHEVNQMILQAMLEHDGHAVTVVADGAAAVQAALRSAYDLLLMDVNMPQLDGHAATRALRQAGLAASGLPIVGVTASAFATDRQACLEAGMQDCLAKPFTHAQLRSVLARHGLAPAPAEPTRRRRDAGL